MVSKQESGGGIYLFGQSQHETSKYRRLSPTYIIFQTQHDACGRDALSHYATKSEFLPPKHIGSYCEHCRVSFNCQIDTPGKLFSGLFEQERRTIVRATQTQALLLCFQAARSRKKGKFERALDFYTSHAELLFDSQKLMDDYRRYQENPGALYFSTQREQISFSTSLMSYEEFIQLTAEQRAREDIRRIVRRLREIRRRERDVMEENLNARFEGDKTRLPNYVKFSEANWNYITAE